MNRRIAVLILTFAGCMGAADSGFSVVVQKDNPAKAITKAQLRRLIMGESTSWPGGEKGVVLLGPVGDGARTAALKAVCGMSESDFSKHALKASFEGGAKTLPRTLPSSGVIRQVVQLTAGSVGIVDSSSVDPGLRVLPVE